MVGVNHYKLKNSCACTLNQWFLHIVAVGGLCMPSTNECSNGWWTAIKQFPNKPMNLIAPTIITHIQHIYSDKQTWNAVAYQTQILLFYRSHRCLGTCLKTGSKTLAPREPTSNILLQHRQHNCALFCYLTAPKKVWAKHSA